jgi:hypothetical protein
MISSNETKTAKMTSSVPTRNTFNFPRKTLNVLTDNEYKPDTQIYIVMKLLPDTVLLQNLN